MPPDRGQVRAIPFSSQMLLRSVTLNGAIRMIRTSPLVPLFDRGREDPLV